MKKVSGERIGVGLRVDVDTFRGTRIGVVKLLDVLAVHDIKASFFFSVGPDNMGRHLFRLLRPAFFIKMLRSNGAKLYGWDILFKGTLWPGPVIGKKLGHIIRATEAAGHEVGLHTWDHHAWQSRMDKMDAGEIGGFIGRGVSMLREILVHPPACSAAAGWKCNEKTLLEEERFGFRYSSDCRGQSIFRPIVDGVMCSPQVPVTLPTYDEVIGRNGITDANYNDYILSLLRPDALNTLTIHAEVEGIAFSALFEEFLHKAKSQGVIFLPLGKLFVDIGEIPAGRIAIGEVKGREGWVCVQEKHIGEQKS